jgi:hypothetical protein
MSVLARFDKE